MKNFWRKLLGGTGAGQPADDDFDPDALIEQAQREMAEMHAKSREHAVEAITAKNNLEQSVANLERKIASVHEKAEIAAGRSDPALAERYRQEAASLAESLNRIRESLQQATETAGEVKAAIRRNEERLRKKSAEAMLLKAQWSTMQIQRSLFASLVEVNTGSVRTVPPAERAVRHALNRRFVRQAIVGRDNLRQMANDAAKRVNTLRENAKAARTRDNDDLENALLREMEQHEAIYVQTRDAAHQAGEVTERAVALLQEEEAVLRAAGINPQNVSEHQIALYEARAALSTEEGKRKTRRESAQSRGTLIAFLIIFALIALLLAFL